MARTIGRVDFTARIDGRQTPRDAENVGRKMGAGASEGFDETWSKGFKDTLSKSGQEAYARWERQGRRDGNVYSKGLTERFDVFIKKAEKNFAALRLDPGFLDDFAERFDDAGLAAGELQKQMVELNRQGKINDATFAAVRRQVDAWAESQRELAIQINNDRDVVLAFDNDVRLATDALDLFNDTAGDGKVDLGDWGDVLDGVTKSMDSNDKSTRKMTSSWSKIPHNGRQAILITAAIVGGLEQMATLGSAAGAGLLITGGALAQLGFGLGATIAVFKDLGEDLDKLPERIRPAAEAFQGIGDAFGDMQNEIQFAALSNAVEAFESLEDTVRELTPAFGPLADVIERAIDNFADGVAPGTEAFENLFTLIEQSAPTFETVLGTLGTLAEALLRAFSNETMQRGIEGLVGWIDDLVESFDEFTQSSGLDEWLDNGIRIFESFGGLLEGLATTLNNLVTPESVERTITFLDNLTRSMPFFESLLEVFGELDAFGLIAEVFATIGTALTPFLEVLEPVASIINDVLVGALQGVGIMLEMLAPLLIPAQIAWEVLAEIIERVSDWFTEVVRRLEPLRTEFQNVVDQIIEAFNPAIEAIGDAIEAMLPSPEEFADFLNDTLIPTLQDVADWIETDLVPAIKIFVGWMKDEVIPAARDMVDYFNENIGPVLEDMSEWFEENGDDIAAWAGVIIEVMGWLLNPIGKAIEAFNNLFNAADRANGAANQGGQGGGGGTPPRALARGGILTNPTYVLAGEAGREAYVPLDRPLSQVDESVRWLAALARGGSQGVAMAQGGITGGAGRSLTIAPGAILVQGANNDEALAVGVVNRIAERLA